MTPADIAVSCEAVAYEYHAADGPVAALDDITFDVTQGQLFVVAGPSGSGKSTLLRLIAGIDTPTTGRVTVEDIRLDTLTGRSRRQFRRRRVGFLHQSPADNLLSELTAHDHIRHAGVVRGVEVDAAACLAAVGLPDRGDDRPAALSGGEQQRLALACATVGDPGLILADEPSAHLDSPATSLLLRFLEALVAGGTTVVVASHDPIVLRYAASVLRLDHGRLVAEP